MRWGRKLRLTRASGKHLLSQRKFVQDSPTPPRKRQRFCISCFGLRTQPKMGPVTKAYRSRCWRHECRLIGARGCTRQRHIFSAPTPRPECFWGRHRVPDKILDENARQVGVGENPQPGGSHNFGTHPSPSHCFAQILVWRARATHKTFQAEGGNHPRSPRSIDDASGKLKFVS